MFMVFDTETTGVPRRWDAPVTELSNWPRVVEVAWILCDGDGNDISVGEHIIRPEGFRIPSDAAEVHGITTERAVQEGVPLDGVLSSLADAAAQCDVLVAHNIEFDAKVLGAEFLRRELENPLVEKSQICTMRGSTEYCGIPGPYGYKWPTLEELYQALFGRGLSSSHHALADVRACADCYRELKRLKVVE